MSRSVLTVYRHIADYYTFSNTTDLHFNSTSRELSHKLSLSKSVVLMGFVVPGFMSIDFFLNGKMANLSMSTIQSAAVLTIAHATKIGLLPVRQKSISSYCLLNRNFLSLLSPSESYPTWLPDTESSFRLCSDALDVIKSEYGWIAPVAAMQSLLAAHRKRVNAKQTTNLQNQVVLQQFPNYDFETLCTLIGRLNEILPDEFFVPVGTDTQAVVGAFLSTNYDEVDLPGDFTEDQCSVITSAKELVRNALFPEPTAEINVDSVEIPADDLMYQESIRNSPEVADTFPDQPSPQTESISSIPSGISTAVPPLAVSSSLTPSSSVPDFTPPPPPPPTRTTVPESRVRSSQQQVYAQQFNQPSVFSGYPTQWQMPTYPLSGLQVLPCASQQSVPMKCDHCTKTY
eukprot:84209_1